MSVQRLVKLITQREKLTETINDEMLKTYPDGSTVHWMLGQHLQGGTVIGANWERIKVRNSLTGKEFWLNLYRILDAEKVAS